MTDSLAALHNRIVRDQVGVVTILETVIDELEREHSRVLLLAQGAAGALREVKERFESMRDSLYLLEEATKIFDGDGYARPRRLPEKLRQVLAATCSAAELEDLRARYGEAFDFREPVARGATLRNFNRDKEPDNG